jgi:hypothetical protein
MVFNAWLTNCMVSILKNTLYLRAILTPVIMFEPHYIPILSFLKGKQFVDRYQVDIPISEETFQSTLIEMAHADLIHLSIGKMAIQIKGLHIWNCIKKAIQ